MKNIIIILDPAHGKNVSGKCSPDGSHKEYLWSRERVESLKLKLTSLGYEVFVTTESENEPGLSKRKNFASQVRNGERKLLLSLHNNASGSDGTWRDKRGFAVYTTKGVTDADICADIIFKTLKKNFPEHRARFYSHEKLGSDFEENFTVLMGSGYMGVLIEWLFQDNQDDVKYLRDYDCNQKFEGSLIESIEEVNNYFKV